jgi:hypothetical protein
VLELEGDRVTVAFETVGYRTLELSTVVEGRAAAAGLSAVCPRRGLARDRHALPAPAG